MKELTKAEEQVMQYIWKLERAFLKDIMEEFPDPKPAYTTVSTVIRVLVKKKFLGFDRFGKVNQYFPLVSKTAYSSYSFKGMLKHYFNNSVSKFTSFFTGDEELSLSELEEIKQIIEGKIEDKKSRK